MIERRTLLKMGLIAPVALSLPVGAFAASDDVDAWIVDRRYFPVEQIGSTSAPVHVVDGDVTALWYHTLDPRWRKPGFVLAGFTGTDVLFVLEHLAWDRGRRVIERQRMRSAARIAVPLIRWVIAPVHPSVRV